MLPFRVAAALIACLSLSDTGALASRHTVRDLRLANAKRSRGRAQAKTPKCIKRTVHDNFTHFDASIWALESGSAHQLNYANGLNMTLNQVSNSIVLATHRQWVPPVTATFSVLASNAPGIVSPVIFRGLTDGTDEVDLEFIGAAPMSVQTVLWRLGKRVAFDLSDVDDVNTQTSWHQYQLTWTKTALQLYIDGQYIRTMQKPSTAGSNWPQGAQALSFKIGPWASDSADWAGRLDWHDNPNPVMGIKGLTISGCATS